MDSYYSSIKLFEDLQIRKTGATGIIKKSRKNLPKEFVTANNKKPVEISTCGPLLLTKWKDKKQIICLSTAHDSDLIYSEKFSAEKKKKIVKKIPNCIYNYSKFMRGVDHLDQQIQTYRYPHRNNKWWMYHIFEITIYNVYLLWKEGQLDKNITFLNFRETLSKELLSAGNKIEIDEKMLYVHPNKITYKGIDFVETSYLHNLITVEKKKECLQCIKSGIKTITIFRCQQCGDAVCPKCFGNYHKEKLILI